MQNDEFIDQVRERAGLSSRTEAERAVWTTLEALAERVTDGVARNLAAQLPKQVGDHLRRHAPEQAGTGERFSIEEFFERVAGLEGVDPQEAALHARAVLEVTDEATTGGLMAKLREQLPDDFQQLFQRGPGHGRE